MSTIYTPDEPYIINGILFSPFEKWLPITELVVPGIAAKYYVSNYGRVARSISNEHIELMTQYQKDNNYLKVSLSVWKGNLVIRKEYHVHRLVLMTFKYQQGCEKLDVNHKDTIKTHNWLWNLEWATRRENIRHALRTGRMGLGENATGSIMSNGSIRTVCELLDQGMPYTSVVKETGVPPHIVYEVYRGNTWLSISKDYSFLKKRYTKYFNEDQLGEIYDMVMANPNMIPEQVLLNINYPLASLSEPKQRVAINLVNKMRCDLGLDFIIW